MTNEEEAVIELSASGRAVLGNRAFQLVMTAIKAEYIEDFGKTKLFGGEKHREKIWVAMDVVNRLEEKIEKMLSDAEYLKKELKRRNISIRGE